MEEFAVTNPVQPGQGTPHALRGLRARLQQIFGELLGLPTEQVPPATTFLELGADSLLLLRASQRIQHQFGVMVPFRRLMEELVSVEALAAGLMADLADQRPAAPPAESPGATSIASADLPPVIPRPDAIGGGAPPAESAGLESILASQLQLMERQLELLSRNRRAAPGGTPQQPAAGSNLKARPGAPAPAPQPAPTPAPASRATEVYVPYQPIDRSPAGDLDLEQHEHIDRLLKRLTARTGRSKDWAQAHRRHLANNRATAGFRLLWKELVYPLVGQRGAGAYLWDLDGNRHLDLTMGFGSLLFGHSPDFLRDALAAQLELGVQIGPESETAGEVAALICELTGAERATFCNSGTEAVMVALRLARAVTGRPKIALFAGSFHGTFDGVLAQGERLPDGRLRAVPLAPGIPPGLVADVLVLDYSSWDSLAVVEAHAGELAAVLVEPRQSRRPDLDQREFLAQLRTLTARAGIALIFDEVVTGFRCHAGGLQALYGVRADITTYGKAVANGMPLGVVAGKAAFLDAVDGGDWRYGDSSLPQANTTFFSGTFFRHPLVMAAARACLLQIKARPGLQAELNQRTARLVGALDDLFAGQGVPARMSHWSSLFFFNFPDPMLRDLFYFHLLDRGIYVWERRICYLSTAHGDAEVERIIAATADSLRELEEGGLWHAAPPSATSSLPLTEDQRELWELSHRGEDGSRALHLALALDCRGPLDRGALERSLQSLTDRHEALRLTFAAGGEGQRIARRLQATILWTDLDGGAQRPADLLAAEARRPFDLEAGPLLRWHVFRTGMDHHVVGLFVHHLAVDGTSISILLGELAALYAAELTGKPPALVPPQLYSHSVRAVCERERSAEMAAHEAFWLRLLAPLPLPLALPLDRPRPPRRTFAGDQLSKPLAPELSAAVRQLGARLGCTASTLLLTAVALLLNRLTGQDDLVIGMPLTGHLADAPPLVGYFLHLAPLRLRIAPGDGFADLAVTVRRAVLDAHEHAACPLRRLVHRLGLDQVDDRPPLVAALFNFEASAPPRFHGLEVEAFGVPCGAAEFEIFWNVSVAGETYQVESIWNTDLLDASTVESWQGLLSGLLAAAVVAPELPVSSLDLAEHPHADVHPRLRQPVHP